MKTRINDKVKFFISDRYQFSMIKLLFVLLAMSVASAFFFSLLSTPTKRSVILFEITFVKEDYNTLSEKEWNSFQVSEGNVILESIESTIRNRLESNLDLKTLKNPKRDKMYTVVSCFSCDHKILTPKNIAQEINRNINLDDAKANVTEQLVLIENKKLNNTVKFFLVSILLNTIALVFLCKFKRKGSIK